VGVPPPNDGGASGGASGGVSGGASVGLMGFPLVNYGGENGAVTRTSEVAESRVSEATSDEATERVSPSDEATERVSPSDEATERVSPSDEATERVNCYISAGVSNEESFTRDFLARFGAMYALNESNCFAFDGTIDAYPVQYTDKITFYKKNIGGAEVDSETETNLRFVLNKYSHVFLKMDIEGGEYPWLLRMSLDDLRKIKQMVIEFHGLTATSSGWGCSYEDKLRCLKKLNETHYIIHAHGNNHSPVVGGIPDVIELTCIEKSCFLDDKGVAVVPPLNTTPLPIPGLDFPNMRWGCDINLNVFPFVSID